MKRIILLFACAKMLFFINTRSLWAQGESLPDNPYASFFQEAYVMYPAIPRGVLEAVAFTMTRFEHFDGSQQESCIGLPKTYTVMGLTADGKNYFRNNLSLVAQLSGTSAEEMITDPKKAIMAYAKAFHQLSQQYNLYSSHPQDYIKVLVDLSELPVSNASDEYPMMCYLYQIFWFLTLPDAQEKYNFPRYQINLSGLFQENYSVLAAPKVIIEKDCIRNEAGQTFKPKGNVINKSPDYPPALWNPAASCNYSSRNGTAISAITIHTVQGTYAGCISWFQNCQAGVSAHYVIRSSDGQITQMVLEADKAWHVGSENPYTIGYEHEGYVSNPSWYTTAMYQSSANLTKDVCNSGYGINRKRTFRGPATSGLNTLGSCIRIKGHQHYPNQTHTDPGIYWDWDYYYKLVNDADVPQLITASSGNFYDSGGPSGNYSNDERKLYHFQAPSGNTITLNFSQFSLETNWDYMYFYDGNSVFSNLLGTYTGTNGPGTLTSPGNHLLVEFTSDCSTVSSGWAATWNFNGSLPQPGDTIKPTTSATASQYPWVTANFSVNFNDNDNVGVEKSFYQVIDNNNGDWRANANNGFFSDNFDQSTIHPDWTISTGNWSLNNGYLVQSDENLSNTNIYASLNQMLSNRYLYHWQGKIEGNGTNRRAGFHYFCDSAHYANRKNSYFVWYRLDNDKIQLYKVVNDNFGSPVVDIPYDFNQGQWYDFKVIFDRIMGKHWIYVNDQLITTWTDNSPHVNGNYISFRSGNSVYTVNNLKVYRSRYPNVTVTVGSGNVNDIRYQSPNPTTIAAKVKSIVMDSSANLSSIHYLDLYVDWTPPTDVFVNDGTGPDIDTSYAINQLSANWTSSNDPHSGITGYYYCIGTSPGDSDVVNWTFNWAQTSISVNNNNLTPGQLYYFSVKAQNGAGLLSNPQNSDGQVIVINTGLSPHQPLQISAFPTITNDAVHLSLSQPAAVQLTLSDVNGKILHQEELHNVTHHTLSLRTLPLATGYYFLSLSGKDFSATYKIIVQP